jgi:aryl carrier-like protein
VEPEGDFTTITDDVIDHGEEMVAKGLDSIIDSRYLSYLS